MANGRSVIDEPLVVIAARSWMNKKPELLTYERFLNNIRKHSPSLNGFGAYLAHFMLQKFKDPQVLHTLLSFRADFAKLNDMEWTSQAFELVVVSQGAFDDGVRISVVTPSSGPSSNIGFQATSGDHVLEWISTNKGQFIFCFPPLSMGPDLLFFIRSRVTRKVLLVALQAKQYLSLPRSTLLEGVRTVTPEWFWKRQSLQVGIFICWYAYISQLICFNDSSRRLPRLHS
jgi:hypothetical protein